MGIEVPKPDGDGTADVNQTQFSNIPPGKLPPGYGGPPPPSSDRHPTPGYGGPFSPPPGCPPVIVPGEPLPPDCKLPDPNLPGLIVIPTWPGGHEPAPPSAWPDGQDT